MIDEEWLRQVKFTMPNDVLGMGDVEIDGVLGIGSHCVVFSAVTQDGQSFARKETYLIGFPLGFHIRELPGTLTKTPMYDLDRLNQKLLRLVGNPTLDIITPAYDYLYNMLVSFIQKKGFSSLFSLRSPYINETLPFIFNTPA